MPSNSVATALPAGSATNIAGLIGEIRAFHNEPLAKKKEELAAVIAHLEKCLDTVLLPAPNDEKVKMQQGMLGSTLIDETKISPTSASLQILRSDKYDDHNFIESMRNILSGIIDRLNL